MKAIICVVLMSVLVGNAIGAVNGPKCTIIIKPYGGSDISNCDFTRDNIKMVASANGTITITLDQSQN